MLTITPIGPAVGATIEGVEFDGDTVGDAAEIRAAWIEHGVVFFPQLHPTPDQQMALARALGVPESHGDFGDDTREYERVSGHRELIEVANRPVNRADFWHTDATFREEPPAGSILPRGKPVESATSALCITAKMVSPSSAWRASRAGRRIGAPSVRVRQPLDHSTVTGGDSWCLLLI